MAKYLCAVPKDTLPTWGLLDGNGEGGFLSFDPTDVWMVVEIQDEIPEKLGRWHFGKSAITILHTGDQASATQFMYSLNDGAIIHGLKIISSEMIIARGGFRSTLIGGMGSNLRGGYQSYLRGGWSSSLTGTVGAIFCGGMGSFFHWVDPYSWTDHPWPRIPAFVVGQNGIKPDTNYKLGAFKNGKYEIQEVV